MDALDAFLRPECTRERLHDYRLRQDILETIRRDLASFEGTVLDVGCGLMPYKAMLLSPPSRATKYVGLDLPDSALYGDTKPDATWDGTTIPFPDASFQSILCTEVLEHCEHPVALLREISRVLTPGGFLLATTPFFWPLHEVPNDYRRLTPFGLDQAFREAGFLSPRIKPFGGWDASLAQMLGLWVNFRPMKPRTRRMLQYFLLPFIRRLNKTDTPPERFSHVTMLTGCSVTARKPA